MRLAVFTKNRSNPAYAAARLGADRAAQRYECVVQHYVPQTPDDPEQQCALIDEALATRPDAFVLSPVHATRVDPAIRRIAAAGIPMVGFINPIGAEASASYVGADDASLACQIANYLFAHLQGHGDVLIVTGPEQSVTSIERLRGFLEAALTCPGIRIIGKIAGDYDRAVARERAATWISANGCPQGCLVANDIMAVGVLESLDKASCSTSVVGVNAIPEAIEAIAAGRMLATADFNAMQMAYLATECAILHLQGAPVPRSIELPVQIVHAGNWQQWDRPYEDRTLLTLDDLQ